MLEAAFWLSAAAIIHHHVAYPLSLFAAGRRATRAGRESADTPFVTIIVPAYNEERLIAAKIRNLADIDWPRERLAIRICSDGSGDATVARAVEAAAPLRATGVDIDVVAHKANRGKVATINEAISAARPGLVALTDASAVVAPDAIRRLAAHFADNRVGVAGGVYDCADNGSVGERRYWSMQNRLRLGEAALDSPLGMSGALYMFRRDSWSPLETDTINDDFVLPMRIVAAGARAVLDPSVIVRETERTRPGQEFARRKRIGAGNMQQAIRLWRLADPRRPGLAYAFLSGKALRAIMPFLLALFAVAATALAGRSPAHLAIFALTLAGLLTGLAGLGMDPARRPRLPGLAAVALAGHAANGLGALEYLTGRFGKTGKWTLDAADAMHVPAAVRFGKRSFDLVGGVALFVVFALALPFVALAIKLDSRGPVFYRQLRVGRQLPDRTELFELVKFRSMRTDAEKAGAAWATKGDSRVTRVGAFMRKTRLDELPQAINVLKGEMSLVGPRPERPAFFARLETSIPLYIERTYGVLPGITGLAQVRQGYDETIEDVRAKVGWDHAYALQLGTVWDWLRADFSIAFETVMVMVRGRGQ